MPPGAARALAWNEVRHCYGTRDAFPFNLNEATRVEDPPGQCPHRSRRLPLGHRSVVTEVSQAAGASRGRLETSSSSRARGRRSDLLSPSDRSGHENGSTPYGPRWRDVRSSGQEVDTSERASELAVATQGFNPPLRP